MNFKHFIIFFAVFFLAIATVSATNENITNDDNILSVTEDYEDLAISFDNNVSLDSANSDQISIPNDNNSTARDSSDQLSIPNDNMSTARDSSDQLSIPNDNISLTQVNDIPMAVSVESELSASNNQTKLSIPNNQEDSKLTSIYDKVYSKKEWKTVGICSIKYKYTWSEKKINKVTKQKLNSNKKKIKRIMKKYSKKGWTYSRVFYRWSYGKTQVIYRFYLQFYRTVYYNGYGKVLYIC